MEHSPREELLMNGCRQCSTGDNGNLPGKRTGSGSQMVWVRSNGEEGEISLAHLPLGPVSAAKKYSAACIFLLHAHAETVFFEM